MCLFNVGLWIIFSVGYLYICGFFALQAVCLLVKEKLSKEALEKLSKEGIKVIYKMLFLTSL